MRGNGAASLTCYPTHGKKLAQRGDCRISRRCSVSPSPQLYRCLPERRCAPTHRRRHTPCGVSPHPHGARLALGLVRQGDGIHYPVGQPLLGDSLPFLLTSVTDKELLRASRSSGCGPRICAMLLRDTATPRLGLPPPKAVLAGSPPDREGRGGNLGHVSRPGLRTT